MAFESKKNNVTEQLCATVKLPKMVRVRQSFDPTHIEPADLPAVVRGELLREAVRQNIKPGMSIGITCGSRGIANIAIIIKATMETVYLGDTVEGSPVYIDKNAHEADGVILCGRIKAHTAFRGPYESGLMKMAVIGMGKQHGAESVHESGFNNMGRVMPQFARVIFDHTNVVAGVGLIENAFDQTFKVAGLSAVEIWEKEPELLKEAKTKMGRIWIEKTDVLVVDKIGKNFSGDGMEKATGSASSICDRTAISPLIFVWSYSGFSNILIRSPITCSTP